MSEKFYKYDRYVTIFHYDKWNKFFISKEDYYFQPKGLGLPGSSTDIELPNQALPAGKIYVFEHDRWVIKEDTFPRVVSTERNYIYMKNLPKYFHIGSYDYHKMPQYEEIERFTNPQLQASITSLNNYE